MKIDVSMEDNREETIEALHSQLAEALEEIGADASATAGDVCPVDTGNLKNSISYAVDGTIVYVGTNVEYAPYQELGTSRGIVGKHFLQFGVSAHSEEYGQIIKDHLSD